MHRQRPLGVRDDVDTEREAHKQQKGMETVVDVQDRKILRYLLPESSIGMRSESPVRKDKRTPAYGQVPLILPKEYMGSRRLQTIIPKGASLDLLPPKGPALT